MVGIDTASIDFGPSRDFLAHRRLLERNIPVLENLANLDRLLQLLLEDEEEVAASSMARFVVEIFALPMKIKDGSGAPTRVIAVASRTSSGATDAPASATGAAASSVGWGLVAAAALGLVVGLLIIGALIGLSKLRRRNTPVEAYEIAQEAGEES